VEDMTMKRYGMVIKVRPEKLQEYKRYHADAWPLMKPMQIPLETRAEGEWWADMEEVFHTD
jgi:L-rhamnose mutarotase